MNEMIKISDNNILKARNTSWRTEPPFVTGESKYIYFMEEPQNWYGSSELGILVQGVRVSRFSKIIV